MKSKFMMFLIALVFFGCGYLFSNYLGNSNNNIVTSAMAANEEMPKIINNYVHKFTSPNAPHRYVVVIKLNKIIDVAEVKSGTRNTAHLYIK